MATWARLDAFKTIIDIIHYNTIKQVRISAKLRLKSAFVKDQTHIWIVQNYKLEFLFVVLALQTKEIVSIACSQKVSKDALSCVQFLPKRHIHYHHMYIQ